jgi:small subunit ribosomal protein S16
MAVKLRLKRLGRRHKPCFRVAAMESRNKRDGRVLEELGHYDPTHPDPQAQVKLNAERIRYWLSVGAQPTDTVWHLLRRHGIAGR